MDVRRTEAVGYLDSLARVCQHLSLPETTACSLRHIVYYVPIARRHLLLYSYPSLVTPNAATLHPLPLLPSIPTIHPWSRVKSG